VVLSPNINSREFDKFTECEGGTTAVRSKLCEGSVVQVTGGATNHKFTKVLINDSSWTALPTTPMTDRWYIAIKNQSNAKIKINSDNSESGYEGMEIPVGAERQYNFTEARTLYAKAESGAGSDLPVGVEEIGE